MSATLWQVLDAEGRPVAGDNYGTLHIYTDRNAAIAQANRIEGAQLRSVVVVKPLVSSGRGRSRKHDVE